MLMRGENIVDMKGVVTHTGGLSLVDVDSGDVDNSLHAVDDVLQVLTRKPVLLLVVNYWACVQRC